jgi:hypothetical protein
MPSPALATTAAPATLRGHAYGRWTRFLAATLIALGGASLPAILALVVLANDPPVTPPVLFRLLAFFAVAPALAGGLILRAVAADVEVREADLVVRRRDLVLEIPRASIARVAAWRLPLPDPGVTLWMRSGRRLSHGLAAADPTPLLLALGDDGIETARAAAAHPTVVYARARAALPPWRWWHYAVKYPLLALGPAAVLFYTHQSIAFGGPFGEYYLVGLGPYLRDAAVHWATVIAYLVLYASVWRWAAEIVAWLAAAVAPSRAARVRRAVEGTCRVAYYAGVPLLLVLRYLPWG